MNTGQIAVTTAGTAVQGPDVRYSHRLTVRAHPSNTGSLAVGNISGDITVANGFLLLAGQDVVLTGSGNLSNLWFDVSVSAEKAVYLAE